MIRRSLFVSLLLLLLTSLALSQQPQVAGVWAGPMVTSLGAGGLEIVLKPNGAAWEAAMKMRAGGQDLAPALSDLQIKGEEISFTGTVDRTAIKFAGKFNGDKLDGRLEAFQGDRKISEGTFTLTRGGQMPPLQQAQGGQVADPNFDTTVAKPAYTKKRPKLLFDEAHNNFHTSTGRYKPFADLIGNDGYQVIPNTKKFSAETLDGHDILVISNAIGHARMGATEASNPAFTAEESDAVRDWVKAGGALLLIADHAPMGAANQILAERFGINMSKMYTVDEQNFDKESGNPGFIVYTRESGRLVDHAITRGRNQSERVNKVIAFTGQSLKGPADGVAFLKLADSAQDRMPGRTSEGVSAAGRSQAIALKVGKGRVIVLGEAAMLSAQIINGARPIKFGMNRPGTDNRQFALNLVHWLSGLLR
ncbi:MAG: hypothetical protein ACXW3C_18255 [Pyrinomonadaceae bacterium]